MELRFPSGDDECAATLHCPDRSEAAACVVMAGGLSSTRGERLQAYGERFAAAGFAALVFDYRHFGDSGGEPRQLVSIRRQLADYRAAIDCARGLKQVDHRRIALWGTSFSGGHVVKLASQDTGSELRIAAVIAQTPFTDGRSAMRAAEPRNVLRGLAYGLADAAGSAVGRRPVLVPAVGEPGSFAAVTEEGAVEGQEGIVMPGSRWRNEVAARLGLSIGAYRPAAHADRIACPLLVCAATADRTTPSEPAVRLAHRAPLGELREYACGHFDVYNGDWFERMVADEIEFLTRHLNAAAEAGGSPTMATE